jgi:hypothetical protein
MNLSFFSLLDETRTQLIIQKKKETSITKCENISVESRQRNRFISDYYSRKKNLNDGETF